MTSSSRKKRRSKHEGSRSSRGLQTKYYPRADGKPPPARNSSDGNDRIKLQFLAAYYRLNRGYARLLDVRRKTAGDSTRRELNERAALQKIEKALRLRDELEDQYAPYGVIAEPVMKDGLAVDVRFTFGNVNAAGRLRSQPMVSSAFISIPLPPNVKRENLTLPEGNGPTGAPG